jgi:Phosphotransferase enzyme family
MSKQTDTQWTDTEWTDAQPTDAQPTDAQQTGARVTPVRVPHTLEELLSPLWLTVALGQRFPGVEVTAVTPGPVVSRVSTNARFRIECAGGAPAGLSSQLCAKGYFAETQQPYRHVGESEACFYRYLAEPSGVRTLRSVYADVDPDSRHGVVITEDVVVTGASFLDARSPYSPDQVARSLAELAKLHSSTWEAGRWRDAAWLAPRLESYFSMRGIDDIRGNFEGPIGSGVPDSTRHAEPLLTAFQALAAQPPTTPWSVLHGDAHIGNVFLDGTGRPSFLDWQLVQRGPWYLDVGYHIVSALTVEDRRGSERELLGHYLDRLAAGGVPAPDFDQAWLGYRRGILYGFFLWAITLKVDPSITSTLLERLGTAAADHDALGAAFQA